MTTPALSPFTAPAATLLDAVVGQTIQLGHTSDVNLQLQLIRMGLAEGCFLTLTAKIPKGPLVFKSGGTEIALGREFCQAIPIQFL